MTLEGKFAYAEHELGEAAEHYRFWRLCQVVGPPPTWENLPAARLDWVLAVDSTVAEARRNVQEEAARG